MRLDLDLEWDHASSDVWLTPPIVFEALGIVFDLDPASPPGGVPWIPATRHYSEIDDGLIQPWEGRVWLNPPYSDPRPWVERLAIHADGVALLPVDTSTGWWHDQVTSAAMLCFVKGRLRFIRDLDGRNHAASASVLVAYGDDCAAAVRDCGLGWIVNNQP